MNNRLKRRVNIVGKVGKIVTLIFFILMIIGSVAVATCAVVFTALPDDTVKADVSAQVDITFNEKVFGGVNKEIAEGVDELTVKDFGFGDASVNLKAEDKGGDAVLHVNADNFTFKSGILAPALWIGFISCVAVTVCAFFLNRLMRELSFAESPFTDGVVNRMRNFAIALLVTTGVSAISKAIFSAVLTGGYSFAMSFDIGTVITALIIFVLVVVFRYGAQLQKESDETL